MQQRPSSQATLVLLNGKVVTLDHVQPLAEALAVDGSRIRAVGSTGAIRQFIGPETQVIDAQRRLVIPGFTEGHGHFRALGLGQLDLQLSEAASWAEIVAMVADAVKTARPGQWIYGRVG